MVVRYAELTMFFEDFMNKPLSHDSDSGGGCYITNPITI